MHFGTIKVTFIYLWFILSCVNIAKVPNIMSMIVGGIFCFLMKNTAQKCTTHPNVDPNMLPENVGHHVQKLGDKNTKFQKNVFYCQHGRTAPEIRNTSYFCQECGKKYRICYPTEFFLTLKARNAN